MRQREREKEKDNRKGGRSGEEGRDGKRGEKTRNPVAKSENCGGNQGQRGKGKCMEAGRDSEVRERRR